MRPFRLFVKQSSSALLRTDYAAGAVTVRRHAVAVGGGGAGHAASAVTERLRPIDVPRRGADDAATGIAGRLRRGWRSQRAQQQHECGG